MDRVRAIATELPEVTEEQPFREGVPVFKVAGKVFAIYDPEASRAGSPSSATRTWRWSCALSTRR